jgi:aspartyl-tRNA(Asn)/glutamyl-tRNA(Gln) amidotransferase subunit A
MAVPDQTDELHAIDAREVADAVRAGRRRAVDVLQHSLDRIKRLNDRLNAFVFVDEGRARRVAAEVDQRVAAGDDPGPLTGVPLGIKELEPVEGWPQTSASTAFRDRIAATTSTMTARLLTAGAVPVGLTASSEIGHLPYTCSVLHGPTRNPWALDRTPGGSSGGSGAALAAGLVHLATGSDMGGSIRLPAGWSGVVGVKGTLGRIPRGPAYLGQANLIHYGPLARSVRDAARYLDCAAGVDARDPMSLPRPAIPYERAVDEVDLAGLRVAVIDDLVLSPSHPDVRATLHDAAAALVTAADLEVVDGVALEFPDITDGAASMLVADADPAMAEAMPEIMANLFVTDGARPLMERAFAGAELSLDALAAANQMRFTLNQRIADVFDAADLMLLPTSPVPAFGCAGPLPTVVDGKEVGPAAALLFTSPFNMSGHPVVSVPMGFVDEAPVGMQIVARRHDDHLALAAAAAFEAARPWPRIAPIPPDPEAPPVWPGHHAGPDPTTPL